MEIPIGGDDWLMAVYKKCKKCGRSLPMTPKYFNKNETSKDGFQSYCRSCWQKKQEVANAMKQMRRGAKPKKPPKVHPPKMPNYSEIFKAKKNNQA